MVHVRLAAGLECLDVQLALNFSPALYLGLVVKTLGLVLGVSVDNTLHINRYEMKINIPHMVFSTTLLYGETRRTKVAHVECKINFP